MQRKLVVGLLVLAILALGGVAGWAAWDAQESTDDPTPTATTVASGPTTTAIPLVEVPSLIGKTGFTAAVELKYAELRTTIVETPSVSVATNKVIRQRPAPGTMVPKDSVIELTVSSGPR